MKICIVPPGEGLFLLKQTSIYFQEGKCSFTLPYVLVCTQAQPSWLAKENVSTTPAPLCTRWQHSRPFAKALAVLRLFPGSHWLGGAIWLCFCPSGFCSEFLQGLHLSSSRSPRVQWSHVSQELWIPELPQAPASSLLLGFKEGLGWSTQDALQRLPQPLFWSTMVANREDSVLRTVWPWRCQPAAVTQLKTGNSL